MQRPNLSQGKHSIMTSTAQCRPAIRPGQHNAIDLSSHNKVIHAMQCGDFVVYSVDPSRRPVTVQDGSPGGGSIRVSRNVL
jgi:hypothetical protein